MFFTVILSLQIAGAADFQKTYDDAANRRITIGTLHGDIKLSGYDGKTIEISAEKKGADREQVIIEDVGFGNQIHLFARYLEPARTDATVDFEIRVPKEIFLDASSGAKPQGGPFQRFPVAKPGPPGPQVPSISPGSPPGGGHASYAIYLKSSSGQITVSDVAGSIRVETGARDIELQNVDGRLYVSSGSGDIRGLLKQVSPRGMMQFSSISGSILLQAPDNISAQVYIQSASGQVKTDFPLETKAMRYGPGKFIQGKLGDGNQRLEIRSVSGAINFSKNAPEEKEYKGETPEKLSTFD